MRVYGASDAQCSHFRSVWLDCSFLYLKKPPIHYYLPWTRGRRALLSSLFLPSFLLAAVVRTGWMRGWARGRTEPSRECKGRECYATDTGMEHGWLGCRVRNGLKQKLTTERGYHFRSDRRDWIVVISRPSFLTLLNK